MENFNTLFKKILLAASALCLFILLISGFVLLRHVNLLGQAPTEEPRTEEEQRVIDELPEDLVYALPRRATPHQLELFELLFSAHDDFNTIVIDSFLLTYSEMIARNFVADFFTFSNKDSRHDIGGLQFIHEEVVDAFFDFAVNTFYLHLNQHLDIFGAESLPTVATTRVINSETDWQRLELNEYPWAEYLPVIIVDVEWTYATTTLPDIHEFQTSARFILQEDAGVIRIRSIEQMPIEEEPVQNLW